MFGYCELPQQASVQRSLEIISQGWEKILEGSGEVISTSWNSQKLIGFPVLFPLPHGGKRHQYDVSSYVPSVTLGHLWTYLHRL